MVAAPGSPPQQTSIGHTYCPGGGMCGRWNYEKVHRVVSGFPSSAMYADDGMAVDEGQLLRILEHYGDGRVNLFRLERAGKRY